MIKPYKMSYACPICGCMEATKRWAGHKYGLHQLICQKCGYETDEFFYWGNALDDWNSGADKLAEELLESAEKFMDAIPEGMNVVRL